MEEDDVALLHLQIDAFSLDFIVLFYPVIGLIDLSVPIRIGMLVKLPLVRKGQNIQASVLLGAVLQCCPSRHDSVCRSHRKVGQILMEGMA